MREDLKQLQARGVQNWVAEEVFYFFALFVSFQRLIFKVSEYLEGIGKLHGKLSHVLDVLEECFKGSNDQVCISENRFKVVLVTIFHCWQSSDVTT